MTDSIHALHELGQSLWYDNIQRRLLENGELATLISRGEIRGITSNPSIFDNAISNSNDYDTALVSMAWSGLDSRAIFDGLAVEDIRAAADLFRDLYDTTGGKDGYVSLEVDPGLAKDTQATIAEASRLWELVDRPNLMVKIPATAEGIPAIRESIAAGINVNVTLIFSLQRYADVMVAYIAGLERRLGAGKPVDRIASVASFFVSRVDTKVDRRLEEIIRQEGSQSALASRLLGRAAVANAQLAYAQYCEVFEGEHFKNLKAKGARTQRPLWASTSTKNPAYSDVKYVEELVGPDTVNTIPQQTVDAFRDHGEARITLTDDLTEARLVLESLDQLGISMEQVTRELEEEGVKAFADSFVSLKATIEERRKSAIAQLGPLADTVRQRVRQLEGAKAAERLYGLDASLWSQDPAIQDEIRERLGWLFLPESSVGNLGELNDFAVEACQAGFERALLLGMGGSSLASEIMSLMISPSEDTTGAGGLQLAILDSTDPAEVRAAERWAQDGKTLFIVSSKSGGTTEVMAFFHYFWQKVSGKGGDRAGDSFIAITDPDTSLEQLARQRRFRRIFQADPTVGGRNSALSAFGLVPAVLMGIDIKRLLDRGRWMMRQCGPEAPVVRNPGLVLGTVMGEAALQGRDKLTLITDDELAPFGAWLEQLIAESTGKEGKGILPVAGEPVGALEVYGDDRLFVYLRRDGQHDEAVERLRKAGHPAIVISMEDEYDLGAEFYRWEIATAIASAVLGVNSFDQPDVQDNKNRTKALIQAYRERGELEEGSYSWEGEGGRLYGRELLGLKQSGSLEEAVRLFLELGRAGDYVALNAYLPRDEQNEILLRDLRIAIRKQTHLATTVGFGPRFLHSTGQMHKGGPNTGLFLQLTADPEKDVEIPEEGIRFGVLQRAQAIGDYEALLARSRRVLRVHLSHPGMLADLVKKLV
jgi:transaldolase / glucose-6-phosphate isomerase